MATNAHSYVDATCQGCGRRYRARTDSSRLFCSRRCTGLVRRGRRAHNFRGGLSQMADGRWIIRCRDGSRYYFYRAVMEAQLGYLLDPEEEVVHHIDGDCTNDDLLNLEVLTRAEHTTMHANWRG